MMNGTLKNLVLSLIWMILSSCGIQHYELVRGGSAVLPWPDARIPYVIDPKFSDSTTLKIEDAIEEWSQKTGVEFIPRNDEFNYVFIRKAKSGCESAVGFLGIGEQSISVAPWCGYDGFLHELGHTLGMIHEHQRHDRDQYIEILWDNMDLDAADNFIKLNRLDYPVTGEYDYKSIMHYSIYAFAKDEEPTIKLLQWDDEDDKTLYNTELTDGDIQKVKDMYGL